MYLYIDVLFKREDVDGGPDELPSGPFSTDSEEIYNAPPFLLKPSLGFMTYSYGNDICSEFIEGTPKEIVEKINLAMYAANSKYPNAGFPELVGWNIDRIIIPALCTTAFVTGAEFCRNYFRPLDEKWSKARTYSIERGFWQGWYSADRNDNTPRITLEQAAALCGENYAVSLDSGKDISEMDDHTLLLSRVSAIVKLFERYHKVTRI